MLVISRKQGELIQVGDVLLRICSVKGGRVAVGIDAPRSVPISRPSTCADSVTGRPAAVKAV